METLERVTNCYSNNDKIEVVTLRNLTLLVVLRVDDENDLRQQKPLVKKS